MAFFTYPFSRPIDNPKAEYAEEQTQDDPRSGYENLGASASSLTYFTTANLKVNAQAGNDTINTNSGHDIVWGGSGDDDLFGWGGDDELNGGSGHDNLVGDVGNDELWGGSGNDRLVGGDGADLLVGGTGHDTLLGDHDGGSNPGADQLYGGWGNDVLSGGVRGDQLKGGAGADTFHYHNHMPAFNQSAMNDRDQVLDFNSAEGDRFDFREIDAVAGGTTNDAFILSNAPSTQAGRMWFEGSGTEWTIFLNVDGGGADLAIDVTLAGGATSLSAADFLL